MVIHLHCKTLCREISFICRIRKLLTGMNTFSYFSFPRQFFKALYKTVCGHYHFLLISFSSFFHTKKRLSRLPKKNQKCQSHYLVVSCGDTYQVFFSCIEKNDTNGQEMWAEYGNIIVEWPAHFPMLGEMSHVRNVCFSRRNTMFQGKQPQCVPAWNLLLRNTMI